MYTSSHQLWHDRINRQGQITCPLTNLIPVYNIDGTADKAGMIVEITDLVLHYDNHSEHTQFAVTRLGKQSMILGYN
jgi:hypothetical protein